MTAKETESSITGSGRKIWLALLLAWVLPGAGHFYLRKYWHAAVFFLSVTSLSVLGALMHGEMHSFLRGNFSDGFLQWMAALGNVALGIIYIIFSLFGLAPGGLEAAAMRTYEYGTTFIVVAAMINVLVIVDAIDYARGVKQ